jgi:benzoyl-CoA reductase/2-hydroxyglutaryl-CoA dehydratase subunit BcrC/BadD/HgdB
MADNFVRNYLNIGIRQKIEYDKRLCREYKVDGAIFQDNRGCRPFAFGFYDVIDALEKEGLPCLLYESNSADLRFWSDDEISSKLETFLEVLGQRRKNA